jgi:hypothetical protein
MATILPWMISVLTTTPERWTRLVRDIPDQLLRRPAAPGEWSAIECLHHLVATESVKASRLQAFLSGQPSFPNYDQDAPENRPDLSLSPAALADEFARRRSASLVLLKGLTEADLQRASRHAQLGLVILDQLVHEWAAHDLNHTVQAERALMQPFLAGCGPWIEFFTDHIAK